MLLWTVFILFSSWARYMADSGILGHASLPVWLLLNCSVPAQTGFHIIGTLFFTGVSLKGLGRSQTSSGLGWGFLNIWKKMCLIVHQGWLWSLATLKFYLKTLKTYSSVCEATSLCWNTHWCGKHTLHYEKDTVPLLHLLPWHFGGWILLLQANLPVLQKAQWSWQTVAPEERATLHQLEDNTSQKHSYVSGKESL